MERAKGKMELEAQRKDGERQEEEEVTEEPNRVTKQNMAEMTRGFSLSEEALPGLEAQNLSTEWFTKAAAATQNVIQCHHVIYGKEKRTTCQTPLDRLFTEWWWVFLSSH